MNNNDNPQNRILNNNINNTNIDNQLNNNQINIIPNLNNSSSEFIDPNDTINIQSKNSKFFNKNQQEKSTSLNDLNVNGEYNDLNSTSQYSQDPKVRENIDKKNTITVTKDGKVFLIIIVILFIAIMFLPTIFDFFRNLIYSH